LFSPLLLSGIVLIVQIQSAKPLAGSLSRKATKLATFLKCPLEAGMSLIFNLD
jgi:hypothetical protein